jgi:signal peptide peptidase SppA
VSRFVGSQPWAITEPALDTIVGILRQRAAGITLTVEEIRARLGAAAPAPQPQAGQAVGVLRLMGVIAPRMNLMVEVSGGTSLDIFLTRFRELRDDPSVASIVLDVDSPGGSVYGVPEAADEILRARSVKPITAVVNPEAGSAALWIASAASEFVITPSGMVGSLGVYAMHEDWSKANELLGVKPTYVSAGAYKVEGHPDAPLSDEARAFLQTQVDAVYGSFLKAVAKHRNVPVAKARSDFGEGRMLLAADAKAAGLVDRVATFDEVLARQVSAAKKRRASGAMQTAAVPLEAGELKDLEVDGTDATTILVGLAGNPAPDPDPPEPPEERPVEAESDAADDGPTTADLDALAIIAARR